jgi:hypothetical protein
VRPCPDCGRVVPRRPGRHHLVCAHVLLSTNKANCAESFVFVYPAFALQQQQLVMEDPALWDLGEETV